MACLLMTHSSSTASVAQQCTASDDSLFHVCTPIVPKLARDMREYVGVPTRNAVLCLVVWTVTPCLGFKSGLFVCRLIHSCTHSIKMVRVAQLA